MISRRRISLPFAGCLAWFLGTAACTGNASEVEPASTDTRTPEPDAGPPDAGAPFEPAPGCEGFGSDAQVDVVAVTVTNEDAVPPTKGDAIRLEIVVRNTGTTGGAVRFEPLITSERFDDFQDVSLGTVEVPACPGETVVQVTAGPFLADRRSGKQYALGRGEYRISAITVTPKGRETLLDTRFEGSRFTIAPGKAVFVAAVYEEDYFISFGGGVQSAEAYLEGIWQRPAAVFTPPADGVGEGETVEHPAGFEGVSGARLMVNAFAGFPGATVTDEGHCEDAAAYAASSLGLEGSWEGSGTQVEHHGYDYLIGMTQDFPGTVVVCPWLDVQVVRAVPGDRVASETMVMIGTGMLFQSPFCYDLGDGAGGPLLGFVMCQPEANPRHPDVFVWHASSVAALRNQWQ